MAGNRRRHANVVPVASIFMWVAICVFAGAAGLGYVSLKNRLHRDADEIRTLEKQIAQVSMNVTVVQNEIQKLSSMEALKKRYDSDKTRLGGLMEIPPDRLVWVDRPLPAAVTEASEIQQTANPLR